MTDLDAHLIQTALTTTKDLARNAGRLARSRLSTAVSSLKEDHSLVTDADHACQALILDALAEKFPQHAVLTEETILHPDRHAPLGSAEFTWVIDPIDGTRNFARGFPVFSVSIAVFAGVRPIVGVVYDPTTDMLYSATAGGGARLHEQDRGERPITVHRGPREGGDFVAITSSKRNPSPRHIRSWLDWIVLRNVGSTALHMAYIAAGMLDGTYAHDCRLWDIAAGMLLIQEAGGTITRPDGSDFPKQSPARYADSKTPFLAGTPETHAKLLQTLRSQR